MSDPSPDLYKILDEVGLDAPKLLSTRKPMSQLVNNLRTELVQKLVAYIAEREKNTSEPDF